MMRRLLLALLFASFATSSAFGVGYLLRREPDIPAETRASRAAVILAQAAEAKAVGSIILGDSITERSPMPRMCGRSVLNAGMGGAKAGHVVGLLRDLLRQVETGRVVIAIGVNDASRNYPTDVKSFRNAYRALVGMAAATGAAVTVATIAPVGHGFQLGDRIFDAALIRRFNYEIRRVALEFRAGVAELDKDLAGGDGFLPRDFTIDGVHLTETGYEPWRHALEKSACG